MREPVKITNAALAENEGSITLRGELDPSSFSQIGVDDYQREVLPIDPRLGKYSLDVAIKRGDIIPDITLACRGGDFSIRDGVYTLKDPIYVVDGLQRLSAGLRVMAAGEKTHPCLGCVVYFNTTRDWERERFRILNSVQSKLSANVLIRNLREDIPAIDMLHGLTKDSSFALYNRVAWQQRMQRSELLTALSLLRVAGALHSLHGPGMANSSRLLSLSLEKIMGVVGRVQMRENVKTFFGVLDSCWGVKRITYGERANYIKGSFMGALALVFAHHQNFWEDRKLVVEASLRRKIALFPTTDPVVQSLAGSHGVGRTHLYQLMVAHINSGKRTKKLKPFKVVGSSIIEIDSPVLEGEGDDSR